MHDFDILKLKVVNHWCNMISATGYGYDFDSHGIIACWTVGHVIIVFMIIEMFVPVLLTLI